MIRKFECKDCHHQFEADDQQWVECPKCKSDNVGDVKRQMNIEMPEWAGKAVLGLIGATVIGAGAYFGWKMFGTPFGGGEIAEVQQEEFKTVEEFDNSANENYEGKLSPRLVMENMQYDDKTSTYSFHIKVDFPPKEKYKIEIHDFINDKLIAASEDGSFSGVPCSTDEAGRYNFKLVTADGSPVMNPETNQALGPKEFAGFDKQQKINKAWAAADLEKAINNYKTSMVDNPYIADNCEINVVNKAEGDLGNYKSFTDLQDIVRMDKENGFECNVKVEKVETNAQNRIVKASVRVNRNLPDWMK